MASLERWRSLAGWLNVRDGSMLFVSSNNLGGQSPASSCQFAFCTHLLTRGKVAKRKTLFDDRPVEINELTYVIKQDLSSLNSQISSLQSLSKSQQNQTSRGGAEQEGEHNKNVCSPISIKEIDCLSPPGRCTAARQACRRRC